MKKHISIILLATILFQSCVAYQKTSVSLNEAYNRGNVKIKSTNGENKKYTNIIMEDSIYYGVQDWQNKLPILPASVDSIYLKDKKKSNLLNSLMPLFVVVGLISLIYLALTIEFAS